MKEKNFGEASDWSCKRSRRNRITKKDPYQNLVKGLRAKNP